MANRYYTLLIIPEKTAQTRKIMIPAWVLRGSLVALFFCVIIGTIMILDYWYVMGQITENKQLKIENRRLQQQVQVFRNKMNTIESTLDRVKTFATRLKVITNIEDRGALIQSLNQKLPDAATNIGQSRSALTPSTSLADALPNRQPSLKEDPTDLQLKQEIEELELRFTQVNQDAMLTEQTLQDQYELLADQRTFLAALPTRKPVVGYFTNGFGVRKSPFGGRIKMHEGLDIANLPGTPIRAPADGVITFASTKAGYGQTVILDHGYGLETWYAHARKLFVKPGQKIRRGDLLAHVGNSGRSTGPHLHYEVRVHGTPVDPLSYILED